MNYDERLRTGTQLMAKARQYEADGDIEAALETLLQAALLNSGRADRIRAMSALFAKLDDAQSARLCQRGILPPPLVARIQAEHGTLNWTTECEGADSLRLPAHPPEKHQLPQTRPWSGGRSPSPLRHRAAVSTGTHVDILAHGRVYFDGCNVLVFDRAGRCISSHARSNHELAAAASSAIAVEHHSGRVLMLDARSASNYYHWLVDVLPKLAVLERTGIALDSIDRILVRVDSGFQQETLRSVGLDPSKAITFDGELHASADELLVPYLKHVPGTRILGGLGLGLAAWVPEWLKEKFLPCAAIPTRRLFITRRSEFGRAVEQQTSLGKKLSELGFDTITLEGSSVQAQAELFASASHIIAVHGAALANIAFCQPGTRLLEIHGEFVAPCYRALATVNAMHYASFQGKSTGDHRHANIAIDQTRLLRELSLRLDNPDRAWAPRDYSAMLDLARNVWRKRPGTQVRVPEND